MSGLQQAGDSSPNPPSTSKPIVAPKHVQSRTDGQPGALSTTPSPTTNTSGFDNMNRNRSDDASMSVFQADVKEAVQECHKALSALSDTERVLVMYSLRTSIPLHSVEFLSKVKKIV